MSKLSQKDEIKVLIKARYPIIWLVTSEELRATEILKTVAEEDGRDIYVWDIDRGLNDSTENKREDEKQDFENTRSPEQALDKIKTLPNNRPNIVIFYDLHHYLDENNPLVIRKLKNLAFFLSNIKTNIIIISPELVVSPDLEKIITIIDLDLPGYDILERCYNEFIRYIKKLKATQNIQVELEVDYTENFKKDLIKAAQGLTTREFNNVLSKCIVEKRRIEKDVVLAEKKQAVRKSGALEFYETNEDIKSIGGLDSLKKYILERSDCFNDEALDFGLPIPKGILLLGIQGCGKSLACKAISSLWGLPLLRLDISTVFNSYVGASERNIRESIKLAEAVSPCILWIDEIEKGLSGSQSSNFTDGGTTSRIFGYLVTWMQEKTKPVYLVATANDVSQLPPELLRKGRFDEIFFVDLPTEKERKEIFNIHLNKKSNAKNDIKIENFDLNKLSSGSLTEGFSGAEIEQAIIDGMYKAFAEQNKLNNDYIIKAIEQTKPLSITMKEDIVSAREWAQNRARKAS